MGLEKLGGANLAAERDGLFGGGPQCDGINSCSACALEGCIWTHKKKCEEKRGTISGVFRGKKKGTTDAHDCPSNSVKPPSDSCGIKMKMDMKKDKSKVTSIPGLEKVVYIND